MKMNKPEISIAFLTFLLGFLFTHVDANFDNFNPILSNFQLPTIENTQINEANRYSEFQNDNHLVNLTINYTNIDFTFQIELNKNTGVRS